MIPKLTAVVCVLSWDGCVCVCVCVCVSRKEFAFVLGRNSNQAVRLKRTVEHCTGKLFVATTVRRCALFLFEPTATASIGCLNLNQRENFNLATPINPAFSINYWSSWRWLQKVLTAPQHSSVIFSVFSRAYSKLMVASNSEFLPQIKVLEKRGFPVMVALDLLYELELSRVCAVRALQYLFSAWHVNPTGTRNGQLPDPCNLKSNQKTNNTLPQIKVPRVTWLPRNGCSWVTVRTWVDCVPRCVLPGVAQKARTVLEFRKTQNIHTY